MLTIVIVLLAPISILFAQTADLPPVAKPDPMPAAAKQAVEKYDRSVAEAKKVYDAAVARAADAARKELLRLQEQETKAGRLESAIAIKTQVDKLPEPSAPAESPRFYLDIADKLTKGTLDEAAWAALRTPKEIKVMAENPRTETNITLRRGDLYLIVPNPSDKWSAGPTPTNYIGNGPWLKLRVMVNDNIVPGWIVEGEGRWPFHRGMRLTRGVRASSA